MAHHAARMGPAARGIVGRNSWIRLLIIPSTYLPGCRAPPPLGGALSRTGSTAPRQQPGPALEGARSGASLRVRYKLLTRFGRGLLQPMRASPNCAAFSYCGGPCQRPAAMAAVCCMNPVRGWPTPNHDANCVCNIPGSCSFPSTESLLCGVARNAHFAHHTISHACLIG